jgi:pimeloyl-ACP methyl ester carboxylesterase
VLWGSADKIAPVTLADRWAKDHTVAIADGAGHLLEWDAPEFVAQQLVAFLES